MLFVIASGAPEWTAGGFASNGYGDLSPGKYSLIAVIVAEVVLTAFFLIIILGQRQRVRPRVCAHRHRPWADADPPDFDPVSNTSVNPARSLAVAVFADGGYLAQVWVFWAAPLVGAALGAIIHKALLSSEN